MPTVRRFVVAILCVSVGFACGSAEKGRTMDELVFGKDTIRIHFHGHSSLMLDWNGLEIQLDPVSQYARYEALPKADIVLVTHEHVDHMDASAIARIAGPATEIVTNRRVADALGRGRVLRNGERVDVKGVRIEAVPAYNTTPGRDRFHPKGRDNGYVVVLGAVRIYIAGDTEDVPEMADLKDIDIAFLPVNQPYTMTPEQAAHAAKMIGPRILYPYHLGDTDLARLGVLLKVDGVETRVRDAMR